MRCTCNHTFKDLNFTQNLDKQINSLYIKMKKIIPPKEFLQKQSSQKSSQKNPPKNPSNKISHKKFLQKKFRQKIPPKKSLRKIPKKIQTIFQKIPNFLKISNSLHRTWRPKTLSGLFALQTIN